MVRTHAVRKTWPACSSQAYHRKLTCHNESTIAKERSNADEQDINRTMSTHQTRASQSDIVSATSQGKSSIRVDGRTSTTGSHRNITKRRAQLTCPRVRPLHEPASPVLRIGKLVFGGSDWSVDCDGGITTARYPRRLTERSRMVNLSWQANFQQFDSAVDGRAALIVSQWRRTWIS
jgi:hypothetical protein